MDYMLQPQQFTCIAKSDISINYTSCMKDLNHHNQEVFAWSFDSKSMSCSFRLKFICVFTLTEDVYRMKQNYVFALNKCILSETLRVSMISISELFSRRE